MTKKLLKFLKWTALVIFVTPVLIYLAWLTGNLHRQQLTTELASLMARHPVQIKAQDNAYFDTIGFAAPANMEPNAWGLAWFAQASANDRAIIEGKEPTPIKLDGYPPRFSTGNLPCSNKDSTKTCLEEIGSAPAAAQRSLNEQAIILKRFDAILTKEYQEPYREFGYLSEFSPRTPEHHAVNLVLLRIALDFSQGHVDAALTRWQHETAFLLRQSAHSENLVDKMVLNSALGRYQKLLADYLFAHPRVVQSKIKQISDLLEPFNQAAVTLQPAFESEASASARFLTSTQNSNDILSGKESTAMQRLVGFLLLPFYDRQSTANELAGRQLAWSRVSALQGEPYRTGIEQLTAEPPDPGSGIFSYHNPVGKFLALIGNPDFSQYLYRSDNLIANKKLMNFALGLVAQKTTGSEQIMQAIDAHRKELEHPFTGEPPVWDSKSRTLSYAFPTQLERSRHVPLVIRL